METFNFGSIFVSGPFLMWDVPSIRIRSGLFGGSRLPAFSRIFQKFLDMHLLCSAWCDMVRYNRPYSGALLCFIIPKLSRYVAIFSAYFRVKNGLIAMPCLIHYSAKWRGLARVSRVIPRYSCPYRYALPVALFCNLSRYVSLSCKLARNGALSWVF